MNKNVIFGILIVLAGIIFAGNELGYWSIDIFFTGWWTLFIIIPAVVALFNRNYLNGIVGILIGGFLLLATNNMVQWSLVGPLAIILVGVTVIFSRK